MGNVSEGTVTATYVRGLNLVRGNIGPNTFAYLFNAHGDVVQLMDDNGNELWYYDYDAFGVEKEIDRQDAGDDRNPFRYCGEYFDSETGTVYLRARNYDPGTGRFGREDTHWNPTNSIYGDNPAKINERKNSDGSEGYMLLPDIFAIRQSSNLYGYCGGNPIMFKDPSGEIAIVDDAVAILILAGVSILAVLGAINITVEETVFGEMLEALSWMLEKISIMQLLIIISVILLAKGKSNPKDLEKGMTAEQKEAFSDEIHQYKKEHGMPPDYNLPWEVLLELAEIARESAK